MRRDDRRSKGGRTCRISWTKRSLCFFISFIHHECHNDYNSYPGEERHEKAVAVM